MNIEKHCCVYPIFYRIAPKLHLKDFLSTPVDGFWLNSFIEEFYQAPGPMRKLLIALRNTRPGGRRVHPLANPSWIARGAGFFEASSVRAEPVA
ncbi:hypothetical protein [Methylobacterium nigriterrae]|uniref:hypothetical protein n=1 Tax=Methylobacterium nigriterrae TaxID=3127512 RepID=UPI003013C3A4